VGEHFDGSPNLKYATKITFRQKLRGEFNQPNQFIEPGAGKIASVPVDGKAPQPPFGHDQTIRSNTKKKSGLIPLFFEGLSHFLHSVRPKNQFRVHEGRRSPDSDDSDISNSRNIQDRFFRQFDSELLRLQKSYTGLNRIAPKG
jgi:hypothetical protein